MTQAQDTEVLFYDGACGLCHRTVRFVIGADAGGDKFSFAPLGGEFFLATVPEAERSGLPDSLVLRTRDGQLLVRSAAVLHILERLGGAWRMVAAVAQVVPRALRDSLYDTIARVRYRWFARPKDVCPVLPPHLRRRFHL